MSLGDEPHIPRSIRLCSACLRIGFRKRVKLRLVRIANKVRAMAKKLLQGRGRESPRFATCILRRSTTCVRPLCRRCQAGFLRCGSLPHQRPGHQSILWPIVSCHLAKPLVADIFENRSCIRKVPFDRAPSTSWHPTLDRYAVRSNQKRKRLSLRSGRSASCPFPQRGCSRVTRPMRQAFEVVRGFRCGGANAVAISPLWSSICDGVDDRVVSRCLRHLLHEQDARFLVED